MIKFLCVSLLLFLSLCEMGFAQVSKDDCQTFGTSTPSDYAESVFRTFAQRKLPPLIFFTKKDLSTAWTFLDGMCCETEKKNDSCKIWKTKKKLYPESKFMYDHLVYVGMTKLDGNQDHCDSLNIDCHPKAKEWREKITKIAESREGVPPSQIILSFSGVWGGSPQSFLDPKNELLSSAYIQMCSEVERIYTEVGLSQGSSASLDQNSPNGSAATRSQRCRQLIQERYKQEIQYIKTLQVEKGMKFYLDNINAYINTYFFQNRGMTLLDTMQEINTCFTSVLRLVQKTENCCVSGKE